MAASRGLRSFLLLMFFRIYFVSADSDTIDANLTRVLLIHGPTYDDNEMFTLDEGDAVAQSPYFIHDKTDFFIPDYTETQLSNYHPIAEGHSKLNKINDLELSWGYMTDDPSKVKKPDVEKLVPLVGDFIIKLLNDTNLEDFHLVAYSTGSELASDVATYINGKSLGKSKLPRLTLLDPPGSSKLRDKKSINHSCDFVDVIHTNAVRYGTFFSLGNADFWPNGGMMQPGCTSDRNECSHKRAGALYAESIANRDDGPQFCSYKASSYTAFLGQNIKALGEPVIMGINCDPKASGNYYLLTNGDPTFARGCDGK